MARHARCTFVRPKPKTSVGRLPDTAQSRSLLSTRNGVRSMRYDAFGDLFGCEKCCVYLFLALPLRSPRSGVCESLRTRCDTSCAVATRNTLLQVSASRSDTFGST